MGTHSRLDMGCISRPRARSTQRDIGRVRALGAAVALAALLTACGAVGADSRESPTRPAEPALSHAEAVAVMKDYDARHAAALKQSVTAFDPVPWSTADTGMLYARRRLDTAVRKVEGNRQVGATTHTVRSVFAPAQDGYPRHVLLDLDQRSGGRTSHALSAMTQHDAGAPWLMTALVRYGRADLPKPAEPGSEVAMSATQRKMLLARVADLAKQANAGRGPLVTGELSNLVEEFRSTDGSRARFRLWSTEADQFGPRGSIQAVTVSGGILAVVSLVAETVHRPAPGESFDTTGLEDSYLEATGQSRAYLSQIRLLNGVTAVVLLDDAGQLRTRAADAAGLPL